MPMLAAELQNDPAQIGYAPYLASGDDDTLARLLNTTRPGQLVARAAIEPAALWDAIDDGEWAAFPPETRADLHFLIPLHALDLAGPHTSSFFARVFPPGTKSASTIAALGTRDGS